MSDSAADYVVYYDGACPLCRREIAHYRGQEGAAAIVWVDAASCDPATLGVDLARDAALARLHARRADGSLVSGVAAFAMIWSRLHDYRWLAPFVARRPILIVLESGYSAFLRLRPLWRRTATPSNALPLAVLADLRTDHAGEVGAVQIYRGILAVERFVDRHYAVQIERLSAHPELGALRETLASCRRDEISHRDDALARLHARPGAIARAWAAVVRTGSELAVAASRRL